MKFKLNTAAGFYSKEDVSKLIELGFRFRDDTHGPGVYKINDKTLTINIDTLEELVDFAKTHEAIIINGDTITIYDDYIE